MTTLIMQGKPVAAVYRECLQAKLAAAKAQGTQVTLAILTVGDDPASQIYRDRLAKTTESVGAAVRKLNLPAASTQAEVLAAVQQLNVDPTVRGILPMMPLPKQINERAVCAALAPEKDLDCLQPVNCGLLYLGQSKWGPCTPRACLAILDYYKVAVAGKHVVVIGRSNVVGKPVALLLLQRNATVTICHSKTANLSAIIQSADVVIAAVGRAGFVKPDMLRDGVILVDVGINARPGGGITGDIDPACYAKAAAYTPVPGGVGVVCNMMVLETLTRNLEEVKAHA